MPASDTDPSPHLMWDEIRQHLTAIPVKPAQIAESVRAEIDQDVRQLQAVRRKSQSVHRLTAMLVSTAALIVACVYGALSLTGLTDGIPVASADRRAEMLQVDQRDWQVVVLSVPAERQNLVRSRIQQTVTKRGLSVETVIPTEVGQFHDQPDLFVSSADSAVAVLEALEQELQLDTSAAVDDINDFDRDELLKKFQQSMASPTRSDQHFGEMLVVTAGAPLESGQPITLSRTDLQTGGPATDRTRAGGNIEVPLPETNLQRPVMIVLVRKKSATAPGPQGAIRSFPASFAG